MSGRGDLEEAQFLGRVADQEVLRLLVVQEVHPSDQQGCRSDRFSVGSWPAYGPDLGGSGACCTAMVWLVAGDSRRAR